MRCRRGGGKASGVCDEASWLAQEESTTAATVSMARDSMRTSMRVIARSAECPHLGRAFCAAAPCRLLSLEAQPIATPRNAHSMHRPLNARPVCNPMLNRAGLQAPCLHHEPIFRRSQLISCRLCEMPGL